jgi:flagellar basal-body rod protein FlgF
MENISYIGLSQQVILQRRMEITANNLANMSTPGFKAQSVLSLDHIASPRDGGLIHQAMDYASYRNLAPGALTQTHNSLDLSIQGEGYFKVQTPQGPRYTRDGGFALNAGREIVTKSGYPVLNDSNSAIVVPPEAGQITVTRDGTISTELGELGRLRVVAFSQEQDMVEAGENLYDASQLQERPVAGLHVVQGAIEGSNVNPILEMNKMIEISRMYQAAQRMLQNDHERIRGAIQKLTRV